MDYQEPDLSKFTDATDEEKRTARLFSRVAPSGELPEHSAWLKVGVQYFKVADAEDFEHASWHCWMLAKALLSYRKASTITVNGKEHTILEDSQTYEQILELAEMKGEPTMIYRKTGVAGVFSPGQTFGIEDGMIFQIGDMW